MTDAELIQRAQESEYEVATQRTTIEDLVVEKEKMAEQIESLKDIHVGLKQLLDRVRTQRNTANATLDRLEATLASRTADVTG